MKFPLIRANAPVRARRGDPAAGYLAEEQRRPNAEAGEHEHEKN